MSTEPVQPSVPCRYQSERFHILCNDPSMCDTCGWNPINEQKRKERIRKRLYDKFVKAEEQRKRVEQARERARQRKLSGGQSEQGN